MAGLGRPIDVLLANVGCGAGGAFLDLGWGTVRHVTDTNVTSTTYLPQQVGRQMRARKAGCILITGSIAGFTPGSFQAIYNASKAYLASFASAQREELSDTGVTLLEPSATETAFFRRAGMLDTAVGQAKKDGPRMAAEAGFKAMKTGSFDVVSGWKNKLLLALANDMPNEVLAKVHRRMAEPWMGWRRSGARKASGTP